MFILKSGKRDHLLRLQKSGELHLGTLSSYKKIEDDSRKDDFEDVSFVYNPLPDKPYILSLDLNDGKGFVPMIRIFKAEERSFCGYIYCMHYLDPEELTNTQTFKIDSKDDHILMINGSIFIQKVAMRLTEMQIPFEHTKVEYIDYDGYVGKKNPFQKPKRFSNEREYRFFLPINEKDPFMKIYIGDISDVSYLFQATKIANYKFATPSSTNQNAIINL